jgi:hypothetical protein
MSFVITSTIETARLDGLAEPQGHGASAKAIFLLFSSPTEVSHCTVQGIRAEKPFDGAEMGASNVLMVPLSSRDIQFEIGRGIRKRSKENSPRGEGRPKARVRHHRGGQAGGLQRQLRARKETVESGQLRFAAVCPGFWIAVSAIISFRALSCAALVD